MTNIELIAKLMSIRTSLKLDRPKDGLEKLRRLIATIDPDRALQNEISGRSVTNGERDEP